MYCIQVLAKPSAVRPTLSDITLLGSTCGVLVATFLVFLRAALINISEIEDNNSNDIHIHVYIYTYIHTCVYVFPVRLIYWSSG